MSVNNFAVFILTHGRPDNVMTYKSLRKQGYSGKIYLIVDDKDKTRHEYIEKYKGEVILFSKEEIAKRFDLMDSFENDKVIVYARNVCWQIARELNLDFFIQLDDDYTEFFLMDDRRKKHVHTTSLDWAFNAFLRCLDSTKVRTLAFAQGGDFIGGFEGSTYKMRYKRKSMNSFFFKVGKEEEDMLFIGRMNEDVNSYLLGGMRGKIFIQTSEAMINQKSTQQNAGGMTEAYKSNGTYVKTFYSVINAPSCCKVSVMRSHANNRIHHQINWKSAAVKILRESNRKASRN